jgi:hypothetical protein
LPPELLAFQRDFATMLAEPARGPIAVYRNTVLHGAVEALRANYPVVAQILGPEMFEAAAVDHASECPPRQPVLALYGARFPDWLEEQPWVEDVPYLPDVARVERLCIESVMAADADPIAATDLPGDYMRLNLRLHPAVRFTWLSTPAMTIWLAHQRPIASELRPEWKAEGALFARPKHDVLHSPRIGAPAHRLLFGVRGGETIGQALGAIDKLYPDSNSKAAFASLLNLGAFVAPSTERSIS